MAASRKLAVGLFLSLIFLASTCGPLKIGSWVVLAHALEEGDSHGFVDQVVQVTDETWKEHTSGHAFLAYYADWCGHCKRLVPTFNRLAVRLEEQGSPVLVGALLASEYRSNPASPLVKGFPTLLWVHDHRVVAKYEGDRSEESLGEFVNTLMGLGPEQLQELKEAMAQELDKEGAEQSKAMEEEQRRAEGMAADFEAKVAALTDSSFVPQTTGRDAVVMVYADWCGHCKALKPEWVKLAEAPGVPGLAVFRLSSSANSVYPGADLVDGLPTILYLRNSVVVALYSEGRRTASAIRQWAREIRSLTPEAVGKAISAMRALSLEKEQQRRKEEQEAAAQQSAAVQEFSSSVTEVTLARYGELTARGTVAIMVYAEWCAHCKAMKPVWAAFARAPSVPGMAVARMLDTQTGVESLRPFLEGYPTLLLFREGHVVERFIGPRELADLQSAAVAASKLSAEEAEAKEAALLQLIEQSKEKERRVQQEAIKAEQRRREEEIRRAKRQKRKEKSRFSQH